MEFYTQRQGWLVRSAIAGMFLTLGIPACAVQVESDEDPVSGGELHVGEVTQELSYGYATTCKKIPSVETLKNPEIVISLDGLTLHLFDRTVGYDRVFPIGPGAIENGKSLTPVGKFATSATTTEAKDTGWGYYYPCRIWWTDPETGSKTPVFAGLPFIRLTGAPTSGYAIHGPVDNYTAANGGTLRHGYVSHGCVRMEAADIMEVYGRIRLHGKTSVTIQKEVEVVTGIPVEVASRWIGSTCTTTNDCNYSGGVCRIPSGSTVGTCTQACTRTCPDRANEATTFCVPDVATGSGICVPKSSSTYNNSCARYGTRLQYAPNVSRPDKSAVATVCSPKQ